MFCCPESVTDIWCSQKVITSRDYVKELMNYLLFSLLDWWENLFLFKERIKECSGVNCHRRIYHAFKNNDHLQSQSVQWSRCLDTNAINYRVYICSLILGLVIPIVYSLFLISVNFLISVTWWVHCAWFSNVGHYVSANVHVWFSISDDAVGW